MTPYYRSRDELVRAVERGETFEYVLFWGHHLERDGKTLLVGPGCLSQWWPSSFTVDGTTYATAEHWMMASKARLFGDHDALIQILAAHSPKKAKALGRTVRNFDESTWENRRFDIVVQGNVAKFSQHEDLREYLLATGDRVLVEASPLDRVWGIGLEATDPRATDPRLWDGPNLLGFALMCAREQLLLRHRT